MQKLFAILALLVVACFAGQSKQDGFGIECSEASGHIKLFNEGDGRWVQVKPDSVSISGLGSLTLANFAWGEPSYENVGEVQPANVKALSFVGTKSGSLAGHNVRVQLTAYFFNASNADLTYLGQAISVQKYGVKFNGDAFFPNGAPVTTQKLQFSWSVESKGNQKQNRERFGGGQDVEFDDGSSVGVPSKVRNGNYTEDMTVEAVAATNKFTVTMSMPVPTGTDHVVFDPILALSTTGGAATTSFFAALVLVSIAVLLL